jgi:AcrR family transcriptional regulator
MASRSKAQATKPRPRGRPSRGAGGDGAVTRAQVLEVALRLARKEPLEAISIVRVAREIGVTPAAIHYHMDGRAGLTSGVMNRFYAELLDRLRPRGRTLASRLASTAEEIYAALMEYPGVVSFLVSSNRFRVFQDVEAGGVDHGARLLGFFSTLFAEAGIEGREAAIRYHLIMQHVLASAHAVIGRQSPAHHRGFLSAKAANVAGHDAAFAKFLKGFSEISSEEAFSRGLRSLIRSFD